MRVELEFLDRDGTRVHVRDLEYDDTAPPVPLVGEEVTITDPDGPVPLATWRVTKRDFMYLEGGVPMTLAGGETRHTPHVKISFSCEHVR